MGSLLTAIQRHLATSVQLFNRATRIVRLYGGSDGLCWGLDGVGSRDEWVEVPERARVLVWFTVLAIRVLNTVN